jgi:hypothetical protein
MQCPRCQSSQFTLGTPCPTCTFSGDVHFLERLSNIQFFLAEVESWSQLPATEKLWAQERYGRQQRQVEINLGLREQVPTIAEARLLHLQLAEQKALHTSLGAWRVHGWISRELEARLSSETAVALATIRERLIDSPPLPQLSAEKQQLQKIEEQRFIKTMLDRLLAEGELTAVSHIAAISRVHTIITELEIQAGLTQPKEAAPTSEPAQSTPEEQPEAVPIRSKRIPWTWDRVWESLLSERTLQAILFLGAMLLFASGVSWVAWNWGTFTAVVQVTFLGGFTALFYGLGWYVNARMHLRGSGNALTGVGSLLVPLDFYAFYISGGFPSESWPMVWLAGSLICLAAYLLTAYLLQANFFGYLVATALASSIIALLNMLNVPISWWQVGITGTALCLAVGSEMLHVQTNANRWRIMKRPFAHTSLAAAIATMSVGMGWFLFLGRAGRPFALALALNWWLGALTLAIMTRRYRLQMVVWSAAIAFPVAVWLTERWLFLPARITAAWYAVGWALLVPIYLMVGWRFSLTQSREDAKEEREGKREKNYINLHFIKNLRNLRLTASAEDAALGQVVLQAAGVLTLVSALWSLGDTAATGLVHPLLALSLVVAARLWQRPFWLWFTSLFLLSGAAAWQGGRGATVPELTLPWAFLSIAFVVTAVRLKSARIRYDEPLYGVGLVAAGLAIMPPLLLSDQPLLTYAVGNWIGINGWLAYLAHGKQSPGLQALLAHKRLRRVGATHFHWGAALALLPWLWLFWTNNAAPTASLGFAYGVMAWVMLWLYLRLRRLRWQYGQPWQIAAHLSNVSAIGIALNYSQEPWRAGVFVGTAVFYFTAAKLFSQRNWLIVGAWLLPVGWLFTIAWLRFDSTVYPPLLALIVLGYAVATFWLLRRGSQPAFLKPLTKIALLIGVLQALFFTVLTITASEPYMIGIAAGFLLLGISGLLYAWIETRHSLAHAGIWLGIVAGGLVVKVYSRGSGRSAAIAAIAAIVLVLAERGLHYLVVAHRGKFAPILRQGWRLYKRPLRTAGWIISLAAIGAAMVRNLLWLGGGSVRETWSLVALSLVVGLYAISARLFRKPNFVSFASLTAFLPWTVATHLFFAPAWHLYGLSWALLALTLLGISIVLALRLGYGRWNMGAQAVAHGLLPFALFWAYLVVSTSSLIFGVGVLFYATAVCINRRFREKGTAVSSLFLYPAAFLTPIWATYLLQHFIPQARLHHIGLLVLAFALPALWLSRRWARWEPAYRWPLYWLTYGTAIAAMILVFNDLPTLIIAVMFNAGLAVLSVWVFRDPRWWYPATVLLPAATSLILIQLDWDKTIYFGWVYVALGGLFLLGSWVLTHQYLDSYANPLLIMSFLVTGAGVLPSFSSELGIVVGFTGAAIIYTAMAVWKRQPILLFVSAGLTSFAYGTVIYLLKIDLYYVGLAMWPGIGLLLWTAVTLDTVWGIEPDSLGNKIDPFPWPRSSQWFSAIYQHVRRWWALPLYLTAFAWVALSGMASVFGDWQWVVTMGLGTAVYIWVLFRFRLRGWLLLALFWAQWFTMALINWVGWTDTPAQVALAFLPITLGTAAMGLLVEKVRAEGALYHPGDGWRLGGWSRPFYLLLAANLFFGQLMGFMGDPWMGTAVTFGHAIILAVFTTAWCFSRFGYVPLFLGVVCLLQSLNWINAPATAVPPTLAAMALTYGTLGYNWRILERLKQLPPPWLTLWERPLRRMAWAISFLALLLMLARGLNIFGVAVRVMFGAAAIRPFEIPQATMMILTFAILGLFYLFAALADQRPRVGYGALLLLFGSWSLWLLLIAQQDELQLYALPASIYLLGIGWMEWQLDKRQAAHWIDRAALGLMFGSIFWQSFGDYGGWYAVLMIVEGLLVAWLGSWRRLRRLLYVGVTAVVVAVAGQLIEPLLALNTFVLLLLGGLLVALGIGLERRLDKVRDLSKDLRARLEHWE